MLSFVLISLLIQLPAILCRKHELTVTDDARKYIAISKFGYYQGGNLDVRIANLKLSRQDSNAVLGFSLKKTLIDDQSYDDANLCLLEQAAYTTPEVSFTYLLLDFTNNQLKVICTSEWLGINIYNSGIENGRYEVQTEFDLYRCSKLHLPLIAQFDSNGVPVYNISFGVRIEDDYDEGQYSLYLHNCANYHSKQELRLSFQAQITEENVENFLSAEEMPLPNVYCGMAVLFLLTGLLWLLLLRQTKQPAFKLDYLMGAVVALKSLALAIKGMDYHFIQVLGTSLSTWSALNHIFQSLTVIALFVTIVLIGTGWTFIKHSLSPSDNACAAIVIALQVLASAAEIIYEQNLSEGKSWHIISVTTDLLCCVCLLFPAFWSIRYLKQLSAADGSAELNRKKLRLFRIFYVMVVFYIYSTRIMVFLIQINVSFKYGWITDLFRETITYLFFVSTAYKFNPSTRAQFQPRPGREEEKQLLTESGLTKGNLRVVNAAID